MLMSFSKYSALDSLDRLTTVSKWLGFSLSVWASPFLGHFTCVWDERRGQMSPDTHHTCPLWIHTRLILMSFSKYSILDPLDRPTAVSKWLGFSLSVWAGRFLGHFRCVWDKSRGQMSPDTYHMSIMDPYKTDTDELQQIQYIGSIGQQANSCVKMAGLFFICVGQAISGPFQVCLGRK
jgi:hypothetical protein